MIFFSVCLCICICVCRVKEGGAGDVAMNDIFYEFDKEEGRCAGVGRDLILKINFHYNIGVHRHSCFPFLYLFAQYCNFSSFQQKFCIAKVISV